MQTSRSFELENDKLVMSTRVYDDNSTKLYKEQIESPLEFLNNEILELLEIRDLFIKRD